MGVVTKITQANVTRAIKAAQAQGLKIVSTEIGPDGTIRLLHSEGEAPKDDWERWKSDRNAH